MTDVAPEEEEEGFLSFTERFLGGDVRDLGDKLSIVV